MNPKAGSQTIDSSDYAYERRNWWASRRFRYNVGLLVAGVVAIVGSLIVAETLIQRIPSAEIEVTLFTIVFQGIGYLFMMGVANIFYFLGPISERILRPKNPERYRRICFGLGFWFSVMLPVSIPILLAFMALFYPEAWKAE